MASALAPITPIPSPQIPVVDKNGMMTRPWYEYFTRIDAHVREIEARLKAGGL